MTTRTLGLFEAYGVEIEYMLVDARTLDVLPATDRVIAAEAGEITSEHDAGALAWSNELALHVIELKTSEPSRSLVGLDQVFHEHVRRINAHLATLGGRLMPTAMHPWMDPWREMRLWPHEYNEVFAAFDRIFDCRGHGWANLQSVHLNLPFADDAEFARLHAAVRLVLPLLPALAASSPLVAGQATGRLDERLEVYRGNARKIPSIAGAIVPEAVFSQADYEAEIFAPMYREIAPHDAAGTLQHEWLNSRGAIARFERNTIEIRVIDAQEAPCMDLAIVGAAAGLVRLLVEEVNSPLARQQAWSHEPLAALLGATIIQADAAIIDEGDYLETLGIHAAGGMTAGDAWRKIVEQLRRQPGWNAAWDVPLSVLLEQGPLARRILAATGSNPSRARLQAVYGELCECLQTNRPFAGCD
ncbi:MAG: glutamate--cysteine ligase [Pirellulales bacterium]|nr:glutamate--cysteine ligase [Pirellulales bacterium]